MGTALLVATTNTTILGIKAILGGFICILLILLIQGLFKSITATRVWAFWCILGVVTVSSLILFTLAFDSIIYGGKVL